jgi:octaprenyl-diphosphate synthase
MVSLNQIKAPVKDELSEFEDYFRNYVKSNVALLNIITRYVLKSKGKQMRPLLVFLTAKLIGKVNPSTFHAASLIELMHTATLIHDDVVDESYQRRGFLSVNALWRNKISVLIGDYLLAKGLLLAVDNSEFELLRTVSDAVKEMSEGELLQIEKARKLDINEDLYFEIIRKKTAMLIAASSVGGALSAGASKEDAIKMKIFGESLGIAFQINDDLFDYAAGNKTGKPAGNDIREKKVTLPLIYALKQATSSEKRKILKIVASKEPGNEGLNTVVEFVKIKGGFDYAVSKMEEYKNKAIDILNSFPQNDARNALNDFVVYATNRDK